MSMNRFSSYVPQQGRRIYRYEEQLAVFQSVAGQGHESAKVGAFVFTINVELVNPPRMGEMKRITAFGSLGEKVSRLNLKKGDVVRFSGQIFGEEMVFQGVPVQTKGYVVADQFDLIRKVEEKVVEPLPGEVIQGHE